MPELPARSTRTAINFQRNAIELTQDNDTSFITSSHHNLADGCFVTLSRLFNQLSLSFTLAGICLEVQIADFFPLERRTNRGVQAPCQLAHVIKLI